MAIYNLGNPYEVTKFQERVAQAIEKGYVVTLARKCPQRSSSQNAYLHVLLGYFGSEYGLSIEEVKIEIYKKICNPDLFYIEVINKRGRTVKRLRSSAELTTAEMTTSIERFRNWSSYHAGIYLPAPNEAENLLWCEQQIELNKEYL